jgi:hypothetical protein
MSFKKGDLVRCFTLMDKMNCRNPKDVPIKRKEPGIVLNLETHSSHVSVMWNDGSVSLSWKEDLIPYER